jgi:chromosome partitioning protein
MPVISFVNPKGGSGKTTNSFALAEQLTLGGLSVCLLDTDPNGFGQSWMTAREDEGMPNPPFDIQHEVETGQIVKRLQALRDQYDVVLVDTEGTANEATTRVLSRSHLVIIPMNPSYMDAEQAGRAVALISEAEELLGRGIEYRLFISRAPAAFRTASLTSILNQLEQGGLKYMTTQMVERRAMRDIFEFNRTLSELINDTEAQLVEAQTAGQKTEARRLKGMIEGYYKGLINAREIVNEIIAVITELRRDGVSDASGALENWSEEAASKPRKADD